MTLSSVSDFMDMALKFRCYQSITLVNIPNDDIHTKYGPVEVILVHGEGLIVVVIHLEGHAKQFTQHYFSSHWFQSVEGC